MPTPVISCPMCAQPVELRGEQVASLCPDCHHLAPDDLGLEVQSRVERSLWAALRALEDQVAWVEWRASQGQRVPQADVLRQHAATLRSVVDAVRRGRQDGDATTS